MQERQPTERVRLMGFRSCPTASAALALVSLVVATVASAAPGTSGRIEQFGLLHGASMEFVWIEPGTFTMGEDPPPFPESWDKWPHEVTLSAGFWLGLFEVTQGQWEAVTGEAPWVGERNVRVGANYPASNITWFEAQDFVHRLNSAAGDSLYRLPTEAEWEYACRAGTSSLWSFGDDPSLLGAYGWFMGNSRPDPSLPFDGYAREVGQKLPTGWGFFDMHGNVLEMLQDWQAPYQQKAARDPVGPQSGTARVWRGGAFNSNEFGTTCCNRNHGEPSLHMSVLGLRLVRRAVAGATSVEGSTWGHLKGPRDAR